MFRSVNSSHSCRVPGTQKGCKGDLKQWRNRRNNLHIFITFSWRTFHGTGFFNQVNCLIARRKNLEILRSSVYGRTRWQLKSSAEQCLKQMHPVGQQSPYYISSKSLKLSNLPKGIKFSFKKPTGFYLLKYEKTIP